MAGKRTLSCRGGRLCAAWLAAAVALLPAVAPAEAPRLERFQFTQVEMGMQFKLLFYAADREAANRAAAAAFARIHDLNGVMSDYDPQSELSRLSDTAGQGRAIHTSQDLWNVLAKAQRLAEQTDGAFDVTVGPYVKLWRRARREKEMPSRERLDEARAAVGYRFLRLDAAAHTAELLRPGMRLDLGGIAVGYAIDEALAVLANHGITRALVDGSGDIVVGDPPPGEKGWKIGVAPLEAKDGPPSRHVVLHNCSVTTSGDAWQYVELGGKRYSHIVDPHTGLGLTDHSTVAVIAADGITADSLATAVSVLGPKRGVALVESYPKAAAIIIQRIDEKPQIFESARFKEFE